MSKISRGIRKIAFYMETAYSKMRWKNLSVDGIFRRRVDTQIIISENGKIKIGKDAAFQKNVSITSIGGVLSIGDNVSFNRNCIVICRDGITIRDNVVFGPGVTIYDHDHIFTDEGIQPGYKHGAVVIERGCWVAANVTILRNTHIGEGCVIGAGAVIKGEIPPHSLVTSDRGLTIVSIEKK